jgi:hypothetical protein
MTSDVSKDPTFEELRKKQKETRAPGRMQCSGCLLYFDPAEMIKMCECGAWHCSACFAEKRSVACYCDC